MPVETAAGLPALAPADFRQLRDLFEASTGVHLKDVKLPLVEGRLARHLRSQGSADWRGYLERVTADAAERQVFIDLLTTNETHFFREPAHFDFLRDSILPTLAAEPRPRLWCAASSTGEEPYSLAMVLADALGVGGFELLASDISTRVLDTARAGLYPLDAAATIPAQLRRHHCLKGVGPQAGRFAIAPALRRSVRFAQINLSAPLPDLGMFDVIFLRNVMIYFPPETKRQVVARVLGQLRPGGWLLTSHSESLHGVNDRLRALRPSIYRRLPD
ncbi:CheR family methyltransferase [Derxia lacustris]|uniref:CheR family methyltransferase n=1 Tax=Derxia lacustris TaxID=764842 RepID=UPI000A16FE53|nr:protein-glutamate O-methyltransferase CheR [Derxia lacustris]